MDQELMSSCLCRPMPWMMNEFAQSISVASHMWKYLQANWIEQGIKWEVKFNDRFFMPVIIQIMHDLDSVFLLIAGSPCIWMVPNSS